ncbi:inositol-phosphate phosphatase [Candidatus Dojkabacteria bacterium]|nr:inositol-phosphate phosphatase [Candidatus Dojkabacteria bacterium]
MKNKFLKTALKAAEEANKVVMKYFGDLESMETEFKDDNSPVTLADREAENVIKEILLSKFPQHSIVSEENEDSLKDSEYVWIVDPIDGTIKFSRGIPLFSVQIALVREYKPILGVTSNPALGELYHAVEGQGTYKNGKRVHVSKTSDLSKSLTCAASTKYFNRTGNLDALLRLLEFGKDRGIGDAYAYSLLASGSADVVIEAKTKIWDVAASKVLVEEAGGKVTDFYGRELDFQTLEDIEAVATNGILHDEVIGILNE